MMWHTFMQPDAAFQRQIPNHVVPKRQTCGLYCKHTYLLSCPFTYSQLEFRISVQIKNFVAMLQCCKIAVMRYAVYIKYTLCFLSNFLVLFYFSIFSLSFCVHAGIHTRLPGPYFLRVVLLFVISCKDWASYVCCRF